MWCTICQRDESTAGVLQSWCGDFICAECAPYYRAGEKCVACVDCGAPVAMRYVLTGVPGKCDQCVCPQCAGVKLDLAES